MIHRTRLIPAPLRHRYLPFFASTCAACPVVYSNYQSQGSYVGIHSTGFRDFLLKPELLRAISDLGFEHPSEGKSYFIFFCLMRLRFHPSKMHCLTLVFFLTVSRI